VVTTNTLPLPLDAFTGPPARSTRTSPFPLEALTGPPADTRTFPLPLDAWTSAEVRRAARAGRTPLTPGGALVTKTCMTACGAASKTSRRDAVISALAMIGSAFVFTTLAYVARRAGHDRAGQALAGFAFPASLLCAMPFLYLRGRSWRTQLVVVGVPMLILAAIAVASTMLA